MNLKNGKNKYQFFFAILAYCARIFSKALALFFKNSKQKNVF
jgi:hypothetical protein